MSDIIVTIIGGVVAIGMLIFGRAIINVIRIWWITRALNQEARTQVYFWRYLHNQAYSEGRFREAKLAKAKEVMVIATNHPIVEKYGFTVPEGCVEGFLEQKSDAELDALIFSARNLSASDLMMMRGEDIPDKPAKEASTDPSAQSRAWVAFPVTLYAIQVLLMIQQYDDYAGTSSYGGPGGVDLDSFVLALALALPFSAPAIIGAISSLCIGNGLARWITAMPGIIFWFSMGLVAFWN